MAILIRFALADEIVHLFIVFFLLQVLDLSWSNCGRCLMAVSKDGTLAFINFSVGEIGHPLSEDETVSN